MRSLAVRNIEDVEFLLFEANFIIECEAVCKPLIGEAETILWVAKVLNFHLLEFARAEGKVSGVNFVAKGFANLRNPKGKFDPVRVHYVFVLHENGLSGFWAKVSRRAGIIVICGGTHLGFKHEFEVPGLGEERTIFWIVVCDFFFFGRGFSNQDEFLGRDLLIREELGVKLSGGFPRFVFILIRLV